ncbi:hypothetical protein CEE36_08715 [candidate division TA06 bacterium B3_TA06]|uniref:Uncharacterized protein n=1 Tax=candidate division TA06 bacterium B3_TA06 TaxID=2012487 RepID=A0A532V193_UNCT6|nr:MAG: hypothetical protein CEE36_08715 [candidate division TA06 bacterium B3_TA06]
MKRFKAEWIGIAIVILILFFGATVLRANEMFLIEDYEEGDTTLQVSEFDTLTMASISFTLDREAFVTVATGGFIQYDYVDNRYQEHADWVTIEVPAIYGCSWITKNEEKVPVSVGSPEISGSYIFALDPGNYEFELKMYTYHDDRLLWSSGDKFYSLIHHPRIQALVILSDTVENHVAERPPERGDPIQASLITSGPSINVPGCIEVRDITGRTVKNCVISGDRVMLSTLSRGSYFLERENGRSVKLVKM